MNKTLHVVYWTFTTGDDDNNEIKIAKRDEFTDMGEMLRFLEWLRKQRREGVRYSHITSASEIAESVGEPGVEATGPDYDWKKRRK